MKTNKAYMNWSGGKDSALALHSILAGQAYEVGCLLTNVNASHNRVSMHGVRRELIRQQAQAIGISLQTVELPDQPDMLTYENAMADRVKQLKNEGYATAVFGDIFLEDLRMYRETKLKEVDVRSHFPLWGQDTTLLMQQFIALGFKAVVVCVNGQYLDKDFCGRTLDQDFLNDLPPGVDPCGENGEYHSFVYDGPIFQYPVRFDIGDTVCRRYPAPATQLQSAHKMDQPSYYDFYFCDLI